MTVSNELESPACSTREFTRPSVIRAWLREADIRPNRILGQNFLIDGNVLSIMLATAEIQCRDRVLEVGPGVGGLTTGLLQCGANVVAIEKDSRLVPFLRAKLPNQNKLQLIEGDALEIAETVIQQEGINKFVANLPYTPGTRILVDIVTSAARPQLIAVMLQDEVATRITAEPGSHAFGLLGLWCRAFYDAEYVKRVSPNCFWPRPQVQSAIVKLCRRYRPNIPVEGLSFFQQMTRRIFQQRRKQMGHLLGKLFVDASTRQTARDLLPAEYQHFRPEALPLDVWFTLSENMRMKSDWNMSLEKSEGGVQDGW